MRLTSCSRSAARSRRGLAEICWTSRCNLAPFSGSHAKDRAHPALCLRQLWKRPADYFQDSFHKFSAFQNANACLRCRNTSWAIPTTSHWAAMTQICWHLLDTGVNLQSWSEPTWVQTALQAGSPGLLAALAYSPTNISKFVKVHHLSCPFSPALKGTSAAQIHSTCASCTGGDSALRLR